MSRIRDIANILSGGSSAIATDAEIPSYVAGKNRVINGDFAINQRGFTSTGSGGVFFADRWQTTFFSGTATFTTPNIDYGSFDNQTSNKVLRITSGASTNDAGIRQKIENVSTLAGQTITVSFWIRSSGTTINVDLVEALQDFGSGGSSAVYTYASTANKNYGSSWTRLSFQISVPSVAGKTIGVGNFLSIRIDPVNNLANGEWVEITHIQVEAGATATSFSTSTGNPQAELAACQRYYAITTHVGSIATGPTGVLTSVRWPVTMRTTPTTSVYSFLGGSILSIRNSATGAVHSVASPGVIVAFQGSYGPGILYAGNGGSFSPALTAGGGYDFTLIGEAEL